MSREITRRDFLKLGGGALACAAAGATGVALAGETRRPNVLFILADDLGWRDTSIYGSTWYQTPNIDRLVRRGMMFTNAYSASPLCSPTRASILTGLHPARVGITTPSCHVPQEVFEQTLAERAVPTQKALTPNTATRLKLEYFTLAEAFHAAGYRTGHFGKWHLGMEPYDPLHQGFDVDVPHWWGPGPAGTYVAPWKYPPKVGFTGEPGEHVEDRMAREAIRFLRENRDRPFYMSYWAFSVHAPYDAKKAYIEEWRARADPNNPQRNPVMGGMIQSLDENVGRLVAELDALGLSDNTIIVFASDNGGNMYDVVEGLPPTNNAPLRNGKGNIYEGGVRTPCAVVWPGVVKPDTRSEEIVSSVDWHPTLLEMTGLRAQAGQRFDGVSLVPALRGRRLEREAIFCHFPHYVPSTGNLPATSVRQGDWKLIRFYADGEKQADRLELYNLRDDIGEANNLAEKMPARARAMNALISGFLKETGAVVPRPNPRYDPNPPPWTPSSDATVRLKGGLLVVESTGADPFVWTREVPAVEGELLLEFRMRSTSSGPGLAFAGLSGATFVRGSGVPFQVTHDGEWHDYQVKLTARQKLGAVRIDPATSAGRIEFEWIRLKAADGAVLKEWRFAAK